MERSTGYAKLGRDRIAYEIIGMDEATDGEIWVSRTVADLVVGSDQAFADRGSFRLRGIDGGWRLLAVEAA